MYRRFRNVLITGAIVLVPVVLTWYVLLSMFRFLDGLTGKLVTQFLGYPVPGLGLLLTLAIVTVTGILARSLIGRPLIHWGQSVLAGMPIVRGVYTTIRQITDAFTVTEQTAFKRVALIEYPRQGIYSLAFVTAQSPSVIEAVAGRQLLSVFLPTTPNPTSGFLLLLPVEDVRLLDMSVEDGLKLIISGGVLSPEIAQVAAVDPKPVESGGPGPGG